MSKGKENPETVKRRNAQPGRQAQRSAQGSQWHQQHPEVKRERNRERYAKCGRVAEMLEIARKPLNIRSENVAVTSDWHIPFEDNTLVEKLLHTARENGTPDLIIAGDMWDCDNYSKFTNMSLSGISSAQTFTSETEEVKKMFKRLLRVFKNIYVCRGNHEKRWIDINGGKMGMRELFALARPSNMCEDDWDTRVHITSNDHIFLTHAGEKWLCCHPRNFRTTNLSVARDLSSKFACNVVVAHGHQWAQGYDRSGKFRLLDGGGLFEAAALDYLKETTCYPAVKSGFYTFKYGEVKQYIGK